MNTKKVWFITGASKGLGILAAIRATLLGLGSIVPPNLP